MGRFDSTESMAISITPQQIAATIPVGLIFAILLLVPVLTSDIVLLLLLGVLVTALLPLVTLLSVRLSPKVRKAKDTVQSDRSRIGTDLVWAYGTAVLALLATFSLGLGLLSTVGGTIGAMHAFIRWVTYAGGTVNQPPITESFLLKIGGAILLSFVAASLPFWTAVALSIRTGRRPTSALIASLRVFRRRPRASITYCATQWLLLVTTLAILPIAVWSGLVEGRPDDAALFVRLAQPGTIIFGLLSVCLATITHTIRATLSRRFIDRVAEPAVTAEDEPTGSLARMLTRRRMTAVVLLLLVVSGAGTLVRVSDVHPTPDVTQSIEGVSEAEKLLSVASRNLEWTSYEHRQRLETETTSHLQPLNGSGVLDRSNESWEWLAIQIAETGRREYARYTEYSRLGQPWARGWYWTDTAGFSSKDPTQATGSVYEPPLPPRRGHMRTFWRHDTSWIGEIDDTWKPDPYNGTALPHILDQPAEERRNLSVLSRNETTLVLGIEDPIRARDYFFGEDGPFPNADRGFVGPDVTRAREAFRSNESLSEAVVVHDASIRIVFDTATGRFERIAYRTNTTRVTRTQDQALGPDASVGNDTNIIVARSAYREMNTYTAYGTASVDRPAGVPGPLGKPRPRMQVLYLLDYLRY